MFLKFRQQTLIGLLTIFFFVPGLAWAQQDGSMAPQAPMGQQAPQLDAQTIDRFVDAFVAVQEVREEYSEQLGSAEDAAATEALEQEAQMAMVEAVENQGMSVDQYNQVAMQVQHDPEMVRQIQEMAQERMQ